VTYASREPTPPAFRAIVLVGIETENPAGAEMLTAKLEYEHPTS
jgi:hypothetical protein